MATRPKTQESPQKSKSGTPSVDIKNRSNPNLALPKQSDKTVAEISVKDFLDFLKISYQVNEAIDSPLSGTTDKPVVDWKKLTTDSLISRLKERDSALSNPKVDNSKLESQKSSEGNDSEKKYSENISGSEGSSKNVSRQNSDDKLLENNSSAEGIAESHVSPKRLPSTLSLDRKLISEKVKKPTLRRKKSGGSKKDDTADSETSRSLDGLDAEEKAPAKLLKKKLNEVLQEGIFDSVLPYLLPKHQLHPQENSQIAIKKYSNANDVKRAVLGNPEKSEKSCLGYSLKDKMEPRKKSNTKHDILFKHDKKDIEVVIHVCDEIKNLKRDFKCSQKLLISQMGYFAEVTSGQRLEDMDISVHCDVTIFDWLMRWVQKDSLSEENWPTLDSSIVIPVLMSSAFLQMNVLEEHCLQYCKTHINDIIRDCPNLGCINDNVLTRLANLFSNSEIESISDKKDKIQGKLFCKLITSLTEPEPQPHRGHFSTLATIYRCSKCLKLILKNMSGSILCISNNMLMDKNGTIHSTHVYDCTWNLTDYVKDLKSELKSWRKVYWRLWGDCHLLFCKSCEEYFPVHHMTWCRFHVESPQYFSLESQRSISCPIGRYACCGDKAYRYEVIKKVSGCQYREHVANSKTASEVEILHIWNIHKEVIREDPPPLRLPEKHRYTKSSKEDGSSKKSPVRDGFWWEGLELVPSKQPSGLLAKFWDSVIKKDDLKGAGNNAENKNQKSPVTKIVTVPHPTAGENSSFSDSSDESSSSSNAVNSEESYHATAKAVPKLKNSTTPNNHLASFRISCLRKEKKKKKRKKKKGLAAKSEGNRFWLPKLSTRCNQDNQREFEEKALRQIESMLAKKLSGEGFRTTGSRSNHQIPVGGLYVKLEQDWREAHCFSHGCPGSSIKARGSSSYVNVNNPALSFHKRSKSRGQR